MIGESMFCSKEYTRFSGALPCGVLLLAAAILLSACEPSPPPTEVAPPEPQSTATVRVMPQATLPDGAIIKLELATTQEEIGQGLMFRPSLPEDRGMLFIFPQERLPSFWMKDTLIALDLVFLDAAGEIVDVVAEAQPCKVEPCPQYVPTRPSTAVLECVAGSAAAHGLAVGDSITFEAVPDYPR